MSDINLLPKQQVNLGTDQAALILRRIALGILSMTVLITIILFILVISSPLNKAKQEENDLLVKLGTYKVQLSRNVIIAERLVSIENVLRQRTHFEKYITAILNKTPSNLSINSLEVNQKTVLVTGNTPSLSAANTLFDGLVSMQKNKDAIQSVVLKSFALDKETGTYYFSTAITFL